LGATDAKLVNLFEFTQPLWANKLKANGENGFDHVLEIYELDVAGEADDGAIEVDYDRLECTSLLH